MKAEVKLREVTDKLESYIIKENYKGYDPYDVLNSPLFKLPILRNNKLIRFFSQQVFRRIPFNLRPYLGIKKETNPVSLGLCIQAFTYLMRINNEKEDFYKRQINYCLDELIKLQSPGYSGACWGYNFDWEARYAKIEKFCPTVVATGIITNGLYEFWLYSKDKRAEELLVSSANFILKDLNRTYDDEGYYCFSYSPNDKQMVFNATMKGARLLAQVYSIIREDKLIEEAKKTVEFVLKHQNIDGSWYYSLGDARNWVDNFHTAYVLDCLKSFMEISNCSEYKSKLDLGFNYYINNLFTKEGYPKYYSDSFAPIDSTEVAQTIITLCNFKKCEKAEFVFNFALNYLYNEKGYFFYRKSFLLDKTHYMRWSSAWFFVGLTYLLFNLKKNDLV